MTLTVDIPEELAGRLGRDAAQMSREAIALEAHRLGLWTEADLGRFLNLGRLSVDRFLKEHGVSLDYTWQDLERDRISFQNPTGS